MELILIELTFILSYSLEKVLALALFHPFFECSLISQSTPRLESALTILVLVELPRELISIGEDKLAIRALFSSILHGPFEFRPISVCYLSTCELPTCEDAFKGTD